MKRCSAKSKKIMLQTKQLKQQETLITRQHEHISHNCIVFNVTFVIYKINSTNTNIGGVSGVAYFITTDGQLQ